MKPIQIASLGLAEFWTILKIQMYMVKIFILKLLTSVAYFLCAFCQSSYTSLAILWIREFTELIQENF